MVITKMPPIMINQMTAARASEKGFLLTFVPEFGKYFTDMTMERINSAKKAHNHQFLYHQFFR